MEDNERRYFSTHTDAETSHEIFGWRKERRNTIKADISLLAQLCANIWKKERKNTAKGDIFFLLAQIQRLRE